MSVFAVQCPKCKLIHADPGPFNLCFKCRDKEQQQERITRRRMTTCRNCEADIAQSIYCEPCRRLLPKYMRAALDRGRIYVHNAQHHATPLNTRRSA